MSFDYARARESAQSIIKNFGQAGSFVQIGDTGGFDENGNPIPPSADVTIDGTITPLLRYNSQEIDGSAIQEGDAYVFFHSSTSPSKNMQTTLNGQSFRVIEIHDLTSVGNVNVYRKIQLRQ